jgi:hypothetical protein
MLKKTRDIPRRQRRFVEVNLSSARFHNVDLTDSRIRGAILKNVEIDGDVEGLFVNGVDVGPLVNAELDRQFPEHKWIRSSNPDWLRRAWTAISGQWASLTEAVLNQPEEVAHHRVDEEWSFVETLRHLVFVTDAWLRRPVLEEKNHYWAAGLPATDSPSWYVEACGIDLRAKPSLTEVLARRDTQMETLDDLLSGLTAEGLERRCRARRSPGYPADTSKLTVKRCLRVTLTEEWEHHRFAARDLAQASATSGAAAPHVQRSP